MRDPRRLAIVCLVLSVAACGRGQPPSSGSSTNNIEQIRNVPEYTPDANELLTLFNNDAVQYGIIIEPSRLASVSLRFSDGPITNAGPGTEQAIGVCEWYENRITIRKPAYWPYEYPSTDRFYRVLAHEAGHCLLNLLHNDNDATIEVDGQMVSVAGASRIMASRESELNDQFKTSNWPILKAVFFEYARDVALNRVDGIADAEGLTLLDDHGIACALTH